MGLLVILYNKEFVIIRDKNRKALVIYPSYYLGKFIISHVRKPAQV